MTRPLRIQYPNAWYHIMNRGRRGEVVFSEEKDKIKEAVCHVYGVEVEDLMVTRRRIANEPRNVAIYLVRRYTGATLESIGREFNMNKYSSVGSVIERMRVQILEDKKLRKRIAELEKKLIMSQEQI